MQKNDRDDYPPSHRTKNCFHFCFGTVFTAHFLENTELISPLPNTPSALGSTLICRNKLLITFLGVELGTCPAGKENHSVVIRTGRDLPLWGPAISQVKEHLWKRTLWCELWPALPLPRPGIATPGPSAYTSSFMLSTSSRGLCSPLWLSTFEPTCGHSLLTWRWDSFS